MFAPLLALAAAVCVPYATALAPIVKKGSFLFDSTTGERFYLKGLAYASKSYFFMCFVMSHGFSLRNLAARGRISGAEVLAGGANEARSFFRSEAMRYNKVSSLPPQCSR